MIVMAAIIGKCMLDSGAADRIHFHPPVAPDRIRSAIRSADVGVTMLQDSCLNHRYALPNKLFDYVAAGLPVLGADLTEVKRVVTEHDLGLTVDPSDPGQIAKGLESMMDANRQQEWRENALKADVVDAYLVFVNDAVWPLAVQRAVEQKLAKELPMGAVVVLYRRPVWKEPGSLSLHEKTVKIDVTWGKKDEQMYLLEKKAEGPRHSEL